MSWRGFGRRCSGRILRAARVGVIILFLFGTGCDAQRSSRVDTLEVTGTARFTRQMTASLRLVKTQSPQAYDTITKNIRAIVQARHSGMAAHRHPPTLYLNDRSAFYSVTWCAGVLAHDAMHAKLYFNYLAQHPEAASVPDAAWQGEEVEGRCRQYQLGVLRDIGAPTSEVTWVVASTNRYWEVDYARRDW